MHSTYPTRSCFADEVVIDYGELSAASGPADASRKTDDWMNYLKGVINKFDVTRHLITNHRVTISGDEVKCVAYLSADHVKFSDPAVAVENPESVATVVGEYTNYYEQVEGEWKVVRSALVVNWSSGNLALFA